MSVSVFTFQTGVYSGNGGGELGGCAGGVEDWGLQILSKFNNTILGSDELKGDCSNKWEQLLQNYSFPYVCWEQIVTLLVEIHMVYLMSSNSKTDSKTTII